MTDLETIIAEKIRALSIEKQERVLKSVEEIEREETNSNGNSLRENSQQSETGNERLEARRALIGMFKSGKRDISIRAEEILFEEVDKRSGFTVKK
jgi:hypothetical protein